MKKKNYNYLYIYENKTSLYNIESIREFKKTYPKY